MTEQSPDIPMQGEQIEKVFWDKFFHHLDRLSATGADIERDQIIEIAKEKDVEGAKRLLFYATIQSQPTEINISDLKEIIDFLIECGYIDPEDRGDPFMKT
jgi:hypothetical protein